MKLQASPRHVEPHLNSLRDRFLIAIRFRRAFRNYFAVAFARLTGGFPIIAVLRESGKRITIRTPAEAYYVSWYETLRWKYDVPSNVVYVPFTKNLTFRGGLTEGDLIGVFATKIYESLDVRGRVVVDIGASIADSAIYFALRGAEKVYAYEPAPDVFLQAIQNVQLNGFARSITLLNQGVGSFSAGRSLEVLEQPEHGFGRAPCKGDDYRSLTDIVLSHDVRGGVLKMDCEGCEYSALDDAAEILSRFDQVQIEYHRGLDGIPALLTRAGFQVRIMARSSLIGEILGSKG